MMRSLILPIVLGCASAWAALPPTEGVDDPTFICHRHFEPRPTLQELPQELPPLCRDTGPAPPGRP